MYRYAYLLFSAALLLPWAFVFIFRKDLRRQMLFMSFGTAVAGVALEYLVWTADWWRPLTITETRIGIEDVILGVTNGGLGAVVYEIVFGKRTRALRKDSIVKRFFKKKRWLLWVPLLASVIVGSTIFWVLGWHSFWATVLSCLIGAGLMVLLRSDLLTGAVFGGLSMVLVALPAYKLFASFFPGITGQFWLLDSLSGFLVWGIPIEDLGFYFAAGAFIAPLYEFLFEKKLVKLS